MDNLILARRSDLVLMKKIKNVLSSQFYCFIGLKSANKRKGKTDKYLDLARELKQLRNMKVIKVIHLIV